MCWDLLSLFKQKAQTSKWSLLKRSRLLKESTTFSSNLNPFLKDVSIPASRKITLATSLLTPNSILSLGSTVSIWQLTSPSPKGVLHYQPLSTRAFFENLAAFSDELANENTWVSMRYGFDVICRWNLSFFSTNGAMKALRNKHCNSWWCCVDTAVIVVACEQHMIAWKNDN